MVDEVDAPDDGTAGTQPWPSECTARLGLNRPLEHANHRQPSDEDIKRRVGSVKNTSKITKAMELVAAAKLRRAEARIEALRPYAERMRELMIGTARATPARGFPLLEAREDVGTLAILALTGDRGLAGGFNAQIVRRSLALASRPAATDQDVRWLAVGKKGRSTLRFRGLDVAEAWVDLTDRPSYADAEAIAHAVAALFAEREVDRVASWSTTATSRPDAASRGGGRPPRSRARRSRSEEERRVRDRARGRLHLRAGARDHPRAATSDLPETSIFRALLESAASEHGAR